MKILLLFTIIMLSAVTCFAEIDSDNDTLGGVILDSYITILSERELPDSTKESHKLERINNYYILSFIDDFRCSYKIDQVQFRKLKDKYVIKMNLKRNWGWLNTCIAPREVKFKINYALPKGAKLEIFVDSNNGVFSTVP